jgi:O-methyltransferase domain
MSAASPEKRLWDLMRGALTCRVLGLVAELGIAEALADGPRPVAELASEADVDEELLHRCLRALASDGVFAEEERGVFRNTDASDALRREAWSQSAQLFGSVFHRTAGALDTSGRPVFPGLFETDFWAWLRANPGERAAFDSAMREGVERRLERLDSIGWRGDETVVDVGGGNGSLLVALLRRHPSLRGVVLDLPETVRDEEAFGDRCEFVARSFFDRIPPGDVHVLGSILHNWDDESATAILRGVREAATPAGRLVVLDAVIPQGNEPHGEKWLDLLMLALLGGGGRDEAQWRSLLAAGGFEPVRLEDGLIEARCL